ncbi:hypothetical protein LMG33818_002194 [Halomonadaceae bacterium LMG 33818]|uniref:type III secretion system export apparatus subunit SctS n=1 Tax=Cernens ardua TaxID=3402176 RepID=UPI003EDBE517
MDPLAIFKHGMVLVILLCAAPLLAAVVSGVLVSLIQGMMSIQDTTLPFCIKLLAVSITLAITARWMGIELMQFASNSFDQMSYLQG